MKGLMKLEQVVDKLREELLFLDKKADGYEQDLRFAVCEVELEFQVVVGSGGTHGGKIQLWVAELGADSTWTRQNTQTLRLKLRPRKMKNEDGAGDRNTGQTGTAELLIARED